MSDNPFLELFHRYGALPEPTLAIKLRNRAVRELAHLYSQLDTLPIASRNHEVANARDKLNATIDRRYAAYEAAIERVREDVDRYNDYVPNAADMLRLIILMSTKNGEPGFDLNLPKESVAAERRSYLHRVLSNAERIEKQTGRTAREVLHEISRDIVKRVHAGEFTRPDGSETIIQGWSVDSLEVAQSKRKNGRNPVPDLPPSLDGPLTAERYYRERFYDGLRFLGLTPSPDTFEDLFQGRAMPRQPAVFELERGATLDPEIETAIC